MSSVYSVDECHRGESKPVPNVCRHVIAAHHDAIKPAFAPAPESSFTPGGLPRQLTEFSYDLLSAATGRGYASSVGAEHRSRPRGDNGCVHMIGGDGRRAPMVYVPSRTSCNIRSSNIYHRILFLQSRCHIVANPSTANNEISISCGRHPSTANKISRNPQNTVLYLAPGQR